MNRALWSCSLLLACLASGRNCDAAIMWTFSNLGDLPTGRFQSAGFDVSNDGQVVVGSGWTSVNNKAMRWTSAGGMVQIENSGLYSHSSAVSADGSIAVGWVWDQSIARVEAFLWTEATGAIGLGDLAGGTFESYANDISADGSVVAGFGHTALGYQAGIWTQATGWVPMGDLAGGIFHSSSFGISADGTTVVGTGNSALGPEAFRWTAAGMIGLGDLAGGIFKSHAEDVLANGDVVVGYGHSSLGKEAFYWTPTGGMFGLGDLPGGIFDSEAWGGSQDGSIIVGAGHSAIGREAFIWDATHGMRNLQEFLAIHGADVSGWKLSFALAMSADGRTIVGNGINPDGNLEGWIAHQIQPVPEPNTFVIFAGLLSASIAGQRVTAIKRRRRNSQSR